MTECARPIFSQPARARFMGQLPATPRMLWLVKFFRPRPGHVPFPPGFKERLATRGALELEPEDDDDD